MKKIWDRIVTGTREYLLDNGFDKALIGLSGGIDSSVTAAIAVGAVGAKNVLGVMMPSPYSSDHSISDAILLAENMNFKAVKIEISHLMKAYDVALEDLFDSYEKDMTEENIQARIRGVLLMALSNKFGHLLLNTCNRSEDYVGYCTLYGDSCGGIAPIGELYKTDVYKLGLWINKNAGIGEIPAACFIKAPSAELAPGQKDSDDLPSYEQLDPILKLHLDQNMGLEKIVDKGYDAELVSRILELVKKSAFKRAQSPPSVSIK